MFVFARYYRVKKHWSNARGKGSFLQPQGLVLMTERDGEIKVGHSLCHSQRDKFSKKWARHIADTRLRLGKMTAKLNNSDSLVNLAESLPQSLRYIYWKGIDSLKKKN